MYIVLYIEEETYPVIVEIAAAAAAVAVGAGVAGVAVVVVIVIDDLIAVGEVEVVDLM